MKNFHFVNDKMMYESFENYSFLFLFDYSKKMS